MAELYGFPIKTKVSAGPSIKYFQCAFNSDEDASAFADEINDHLANNAKAGLRRIMVTVPEGAYELPEGADLVDEVQAQYRLDAYGENADLLGQAYLTIPCLSPREAQDLPPVLTERGIQIKDGSGNWVGVTNASLVRMTYYVV